MAGGMTNPEKSAYTELQQNGIGRILSAAIFSLMQSAMNEEDPGERNAMLDAMRAKIKIVRPEGPLREAATALYMIAFEIHSDNERLLQWFPTGMVFFAVAEHYVGMVKEVFGFRRAAIAVAEQQIAASEAEDDDGVPPLDPVAMLALLKEGKLPELQAALEQAIADEEAEDAAIDADFAAGEDVPDEIPEDVGGDGEGAGVA